MTVGAVPVFHRAYDLPYALRDKVESELGKMVKPGVLTKVTCSNWASPIVVVLKKNSEEIRICVDFKRTLNIVQDSDHCVLPLPQDIFANVSGSSCFTVLDLKGAYQQLQISPKSQEFLTINTHLGLFRFNRLTYGISAAPGIFQSVMDAILAGLPQTKCYLDILVFGTDVKQCHENVSRVLKRLSEFNVKVNEKKCKFFKSQVEFLGHILDK